MNQRNTSPRPSDQSPLLSVVLNNMHRKNQRKKQKGFDLIQLGLVVALIGLLMSGALVGVPKLISSIKAGQQADDFRAFTTTAQVTFENYLPNEITAVEVRLADIYPGLALAGDGPLTGTSRFGTRLTITKGAANTRLFTIATTIPTIQACTRVVGVVAPLANTMSVGVVNITRNADTGRFSTTEIGTACRTAVALAANNGSAPISFTVNL